MPHTQSVSHVDLHMSVRPNVRTKRLCGHNFYNKKWIMTKLSKMVDLNV